MKEVFELVVVDMTHNYVVKHTAADLKSREACLAYLQDCGHRVWVSPIEIGPGPLPFVVHTYDVLSDLVEPRDE